MQHVLRIGRSTPINKLNQVETPVDFTPFIEKTKKELFDEWLAKKKYTKGRDTIILGPEDEWTEYVTEGDSYIIVKSCKSRALIT